VSDVAFSLMDEEEKEVWNRFKSLVLRNEGKLRGELGNYVAEALEEYMDSLEEVKKEKNSALIPKNSTSIKRMVGIYHEIPNGGPVNKSAIETIIENHAGASDKTINKYRKLLLKHSLISPALGGDLKDAGIGNPNERHYVKNEAPDWVSDL